eukprot:SAG31_NODE_1355_length_8661_cov_3.130343_8_plen_486_part_01
MGLIEKYGTDRESVTLQVAAEGVEDDDASSDSEDERDKIRQGRLKTDDGELVSCSGSCRKVLQNLPKQLLSKPDPIMRELPPDREWERAERALSITSSTIIKRFYNCWGRCSHKKCTATRQTRLFIWGPSPTWSSGRAKQLFPQFVGAALVVLEAYVLIGMEDPTGLRTPLQSRGVGPHVVAGLSALVKLFLVLFGCQHHREYWPGQLLATFEGASWAVLSTTVKDRLAVYGQQSQWRFRYMLLAGIIFHAGMLLWAGLSFLPADKSLGSFVGLRLAASFYPLLVLCCILFEFLLEVRLLIDRIDAYADSLTSAAVVYSRPEAQSEHDKLRQAARLFSRRWGFTLLLMGVSTVGTVGATGQYLAGRLPGHKGSTWTPAQLAGTEPREYRLPQPEAVQLAVVSFVMWAAASQVAVAGTRMRCLAAAVPSSRIKLTGMLGRASWCQYYSHLPVDIRIFSTAANDAVAGAGADGQTSMVVEPEFVGLAL